MSSGDQKALNIVRARLGMVFQQFNVWPHLRVLENVVRAQIVVLGRTRADAEAKARTMLDEVGLSDKMEDWPDNLSGGQKQRLAIARALAMDPDMMLLDEPTSALDPELVSEVLSVLKRLARAGMTMIIVTHELGFAAQAADRVVFMECGRIVEEGAPDVILRTPQTVRLQDFLDKLKVTSFLPPSDPKDPHRVVF
jgi:ABC-type polar amino acid transport system ATPase subunit